MLDLLSEHYGLYFLLLAVALPLTLVVGIWSLLGPRSGRPRAARLLLITGAASAISTVLGAYTVELPEMPANSEGIEMFSRWVDASTSANDFLGLGSMTIAWTGLLLAGYQLRQKNLIRGVAAIFLAWPSTWLMNHSANDLMIVAGDPHNWVPFAEVAREWTEQFCAALGAAGICILLSKFPTNNSNGALSRTQTKKPARDSEAGFLCVGRAIPPSSHIRK